MKRCVELCTRVIIEVKHRRAFLFFALFLSCACILEIQSEEFKKWCGSSGEVEGDNLVLFCYGDLRVSGHLSGSKDYSPVGEEREPVLTSRNGSSLAIDKLCDQARG